MANLYNVVADVVFASDDEDVFAFVLLLLEATLLEPIGAKVEDDEGYCFGFIFFDTILAGIVKKPSLSYKNELPLIII